MDECHRIQFIQAITDRPSGFSHSFSLIHAELGKAPGSKTIRFSKDPELLVSLVKALPKERWIIIDEIQKVPQLLDDVHHLIEDHGYKRFILSGSSARKLKHGGVNMLAGRALLRNMHPLTSKQIGFIDTYQALQFGTLPGSLNAPNDEMRAEFLHSYVTTYLAEEIKAEGIVRSIGDFARFLDIASLAAGTAPNLSGLARDAGISRDTVQSYFSIFTDTLLGS